MRQWINLCEHRPPPEGIGFHGTTTKFIPSILQNGFKADPEFRNYDGDHIAYRGTYFSDTFTVALFRAGTAVDRWGGQSAVIICNITTPVAGDEDAIVDYLDQDLWNSFNNEDAANEWDEKKYLRSAAYRAEMQPIFAKLFRWHFNENPPPEFFQLLAYHLRDGNLFTKRARDLIDKIAVQIGPTTPANGNSEAINFRVPDNLSIDNIIAVIECHYRTPPDQLDPSYLPDGFTYSVLYGAVPDQVRDVL